MKRTAFVLAIIFILISCGTKNQETIPDGEHNRSFAFELFKTTIAKSDGANLCISPYNISNALNMLWNGASGETETELGDVLGYDGYTKSQINEYAKNLAEALLEADPACEIKMANSIWADKSAPFKRSFVKTGKKWYNATARNVDFSKQETLNKIDEWCRNNTDNKIDGISEGVSSDTKLALVNTLCFRGKWKHQFDGDTYDKVFTNNDGSETTVEMMYLRELFHYSDDGSDWKMLKLPYGNGAYSMAVLMPLGNESLDAKLETLTADKFYDLLNSTNIRELNVRFPKFTAEYSYILHETILPAMGIRQVFDSLSDLSKMCKTPMLVDMIMQKICIDVGEHGTDVTSDISISWAILSLDMPKEFFADRPFVYSIVENSTGTILFMGRINKF